MCFKNLLLAFLFFVVFVLGINSLVMGAEKIVTIATLNDYPPYCFKIEGTKTKAEENIQPGSDSSQIQGYSWDIVRESFHEMGYTIKLLVVPWARGMQMTERGKADVIFPAGLSEERKKKFQYSQEAINEVKFVVYIPAEINFTWKGIESLNGLNIAAVRGWFFGESWETNEEIIKSPTDKILQGFKMLDKKRIFGVVGYDIPFDYALKKESLSKKYIKLPAFGSVQEYMIGRKTSQDVTTIINNFDTGKRRIIENGKFDKISYKWQ